MPDLLGAIAGPGLDAASSPAASTGITLTPNATANTKATGFTELIASTSMDASWLVLGMRGVGGHRFLFDIAIGPSTAEVIILPDIYHDNSGTSTQVPWTYLFPVAIPAGSRISARCQSHIGTGGSMVLTAQPIAPTLAFPSQWCPRTEAIGVVTGSTRGTACDPGGTANTDTKTLLVASTSFDYKWLNIAGLYGNAAFAAGSDVNWLVDLCVGGSGSEVPFINDLFFSSDLSIDVVGMSYSFPCAVPGGSRLTARVRSNLSADATDRVIDLIVYGSG